MQSEQAVKNLEKSLDFLPELRKQAALYTKFVSSAAES